MNFIKRLLDVDMRLDKRGLLEQREFVIEKTNDSFILKAHKIFISLNYTVSLQRPHPDKPHQGIVKIKTFYPHNSERLISEKFVTRPLKSIFLKSKCIDLECLSIIYNEICLEVSFELRIIECDGNPLRFCVELFLHAIEKMDFTKMDLYGNNEMAVDEIRIEGVKQIKKEELNVKNLIENAGISEEHNDKDNESLLFNKDIILPTKINVNYKPRAFYIICVDEKKILDPVAEEDEIKAWWNLVVMDSKNVLYYEKSGSECEFKDVMDVLNICNELRS